MLTKPHFPLRIYYDGSCSVCAMEAEHYIRLDHAGRLMLVDISSPQFDAAPLGITLADFMYEMHAIDSSGRVFRGIEAFWAIWQAFPASTMLGLLGWLISLPLVNSAARLCYWCFARIRRFLPKRRSSCKGGSCRTGPDKQP